MTWVTAESRPVDVLIIVLTVPSLERVRGSFLLLVLALLLLLAVCLCWGAARPAGDGGCCSAETWLIVLWRAWVW